MKLKQTALDFDFPPAEATPAPQQQKKEPAPVSTEPIEVNLPAPPKAEKEEPPKKQTRGRKKLSDFNEHTTVINVPDDEVLFSKSYYNIGAVTEMFGVNHSLLRYWENEFEILKPKKNGKGDRLFRPEDIKNLKLIFHLLRERKYTIEGAKEFLKKSKHAEKKFQLIESLKDLKSFLAELKATL